ncbi:MAG: NfeD family protein [Christensenellales bacterium]
MLTYLAAFSWVAAILIVLGITLVIIEMFIPGFSLPGITGIILILAGVFLQASSIAEGIILVMIITAILGVVLMFVLRSAQRGKLFNSALVLDASINEQDPANEDLQFFLNRVGVTVTPLRPVGTVDFDGVRLEVMSEGSFLPAGAAVRVIQVEGRRIIVRAADRSAAETDTP